MEGEASPFPFPDFSPGIDSIQGKNVNSDGRSNEEAAHGDNENIDQEFSFCIDLPGDQVKI